jgi:DNA replication protein DnaC
MGDLIALTQLVDRMAAAATQTPEEHDRQQLAEAAEQRHQRLAGIEMPDAMRNAIVAGTLKPTKARDVIAGWHDLRSSPLLLLTGSTGRGKTIGAMELLSNRGGLYAGAREFARVSKSTWSDDVLKLERWMQCALLVVDDLGRESDAADMAAALLDVIDMRPSLRKRTILITNFDKAAFLARYPDERLRSRLAQFATFVADKGDDMRRMKP